MKIETDIKPTEIKSIVRYDVFDKVLESLTKDGYEPISLSQNAESRIQQGKDAKISIYGNWVREGVLYVPNGKNKFLPVSPMLESAKEATQAHREEAEFYLKGEQIGPYLADSVDFPEETIEISTDELDYEDLTVHAFGGEDGARAYGEFLYDVGLEKLLIYAVDKDYVNKQKWPFVRQIFFRNLDGMSALYSFWGIHSDHEMRGVKMTKPAKKQRQAFF